MLMQIPMNMNSNLTPVNQDHCQSRGNDASFEMGRNLQLCYYTIGHFPMKVNNPRKAPPVEPATLKANNSPLAIVKTKCGGEISVGAKERGGNPVGLVTVKMEYGSESISGAKEGKGNFVGLVTVKKGYVSESSSRDKEGKVNSVGLVTVKKEY
jgi:hypothetical protein